MNVWRLGKSWFLQLALFGFALQIVLAHIDDAFGGMDGKEIPPAPPQG